MNLLRLVYTALTRGLYILWVMWWYGLLMWALRMPRAVRLRRALETLGPIFVKFGQVLSTRHDLLAADFAHELSRLQDQVPPLCAARARALIEKGLGRRVEEVFMHFEETPVASASVAQVHFATLRNGEHAGAEVAVKVLRPGLLPLIESDVRLMRACAWLLALCVRDVQRLKPQEVITQFDTHLHEELDLMLEAANCVEMARQMQLMARQTRGDLRVLIPQVYWDYCSPSVLVMQRIDGVPVGQVDRLRSAGVDLKNLARRGILIFYWQTFKNGFFHADLHPGNIAVSLAPQSFGVPIYYDFGIMGALTRRDKDYLTRNFLAFFERDYQRVAQNHVDSGWVDKDVDVVALTNAIRACCEPHFGKPLRDISFGQILMRLFQTSRRFHVQIQPQLVLLQKTMLNIEGLGRRLDPEHDLWATVKPFLQQWMREQVSPRYLLQELKQRWPQYLSMLPDLPLLVYAYLRQELDAKNGFSV